MWGTVTGAKVCKPNRHFDLVLLDINMPGVGGLETCRRLRGFAPQIGIVMVTVRDSENDKVNALEAGADDYVNKPFRLRELIARLQAVVRRMHLEEALEPETLKAGSLEVDFKRHLLWRNGELVPLSPKEFELLAFNDAKPGRAVDARTTAALRMGTRIRQRTGISPLVRQNAAQEN